MCGAGPCAAEKIRVCTRVADTGFAAGPAREFCRCVCLTRARARELLVRSVVFVTRSTATGFLAAFQVRPEDLRKTLGARVLGRWPLAFFLRISVGHACPRPVADAATHRAATSSRRAWLSVLPPVKPCGSVRPACQAGTTRVDVTARLLFLGRRLRYPKAIQAAVAQW